MNLLKKQLRNNFKGAIIMKKLLTLAFASMFAFSAYAADAAKAEVKEVETKRVCIKTTDAKTQKEVEKCRTVKKHKKHEGTAVPGSKK